MEAKRRRHAPDLVAGATSFAMKHLPRRASTDLAKRSRGAIKLCEAGGPEACDEACERGLADCLPDA
jgi:hypothetical protein